MSYPKTKKGIVVDTRGDCTIMMQQYFSIPSFFPSMIPSFLPSFLPQRKTTSSSFVVLSKLKLLDAVVVASFVIPVAPRTVPPWNQSTHKVPGVQKLCE